MAGNVFGALLREFRLEAGLTQDQLADRSGVSAHSISVLESGRRRPRLSSVALLSTAMELAPESHGRLLAAARTPDTPSAAVNGPGPAREPIRDRDRSRSRGRCQLPAETRLFTGRSAELDELLATARAAPAGSTAGMVVISAIDGMGGVGKSALAVRAAHRVRAQFPDGQLFVDLRGHTPGVPPLSAEDALGWLLRSLDVPPQQIPQELGERAAFYRDRLADTRTLIVLDNAASTAQVRPLLPGTPGCLVLITSRRRLTGLDDAHLLALDVLSGPEAVRLLHEVAGPGRLPADHPALAELAALCGHLPLAIRITAARLRHHRALRLEDLVAELGNERHRLDHLADEDRSLAAVFATSVADLPEAERQLFALLGLVPGADFDAYAAANLIGGDHRTAERLLESLLEHSLLAQHTPGRYRFHDLVGLYARTLNDPEASAAAAAAAATEREAAREAALERLGSYYLHTAQQADRHLARRTRADAPPAAAQPAVAPPLPDRDAALSWIRVERDNLIAQAADTRHPRAIALATPLTTPLAAALAAVLLLDGPWTQAAALHQAAAEAAQQLGDLAGEAGALCDLGRIRHATGDYRASGELYERALAICQGLGDRPGEAVGLHELGRIRLLTGDLLVAADLQERALAIFRELGDRLGEARTLCDLGRARHSTGDSPEAARLTRQVLALYQELGDRRGEAGALHDLAFILDETGDVRAAADLYRRSLAIYQDLGSGQGRANALRGLGRARHAEGDFRAAAELHEQALAICREIGSRQGEADSLHGLGRARHGDGDAIAAARLYRQALPIYQDIGSRPGEAVLRIDMAALAADTGDPRAALVLYRQALRLARESHSPLEEARALEGVARCSAAAEASAAADEADEPGQIGQVQPS
ncbi:tetratricopeptide (TPR) repeat protein/transcriptional regulator with XRE-family HTH domain [Kitasatospora sp. MAP12-15]|uniref:ATP-binding protein n=1 Tax=unclassified Kitasatospora TaxID=2633591 RepID=UPI002475AAD1|nr:helix-turn-helix domain-containing protein [Kitasatospora sp. MAP12-44]MDH6114417.1 tetratricopeptide (TPR) repeat protein/transcriptional regulator with XRE-family HTH domain [Kitasatospora sp. MAP12-44]